MHRRRVLFLFVAAVAVLLAGCSDSAEVTERSESAPRPGAADTSDGTSSTSPSTTAGADPAPAAPDDPMCQAAQRIRDLDDESNAVMNDAMRGALDDPSQAVEGLSAAVAELRPLIPELTTAYDDLAAAAPEAIRDDIGLVKDFTLSLMAQLAELDSIEDLTAFEGQLDQNAAMAAGAATLEIDALTKEQCGISIAG